MPQRMVRAGGSTATMRLITMVRVSQRAVTWAWSGQTAAPQSAQMATASNVVAERGAVEAVHGAASSAG